MLDVIIQPFVYFYCIDYFLFCEFSLFRLGFYCSKNVFPPNEWHFCFLFDSHNYCPTCRESGKGDDPCLTNQSPCNICANFTEEQQIKIKNRRRYVRKQKASDPCSTSKADDLDLLGDDVEGFSGSQADLEGAADNLFCSPPSPQPLRFESLSLKTPQTAPPTPGTAL